MKTQTSAPSWVPIFGMWAIVAVATLLLIRIEGWTQREDMLRVFVGIVLLTFSIPKLMHLRGFADAFSRYDIVANAFRPYAMIYPFLELILGFLYLFNAVPLITNGVTLFIMSLSAFGVFMALFEGKTLYSANMGAIFRVKLGLITLMENAVVASVALVFLWWM